MQFKEFEMPEQTAVDNSVSAVAYKMADNLWVRTNGVSPSIDDKDEFLDLVHECVRALSWNRGTKR